MKGAGGRANEVGLKTVFCRVDGFGVNRRGAPLWAKAGKASDQRPCPERKMRGPRQPCKINVARTMRHTRQQLPGKVHTGLNSSSHLRYSYPVRLVDRHLEC
jgi:hypothetical protein